MNKTFNLYCDESCHIENDHKSYMLFGSISSAFNQVERHSERIKDLKAKHHYYGEIKWTKVSNSQFKFYKDLIDYFFDCDLRFRTVIIKKSQIDNSKFEQSYDEFYYKMYYYLLNHNINVLDRYNIYIDIKDTLGASKIKKLNQIFNSKYGVIKKIQIIRSHESLLMQLCDLIMGAISSDLNEKTTVPAKRHIIEKIKQHTNQGFDKTTYENNPKIDIFCIELR